MLTSNRAQWFRISVAMVGMANLIYVSGCSDDKSGEQTGTAVAEAGSSSGKSGGRAGTGGKSTARAGSGGNAGKRADERAGSGGAGDSEKDTNSSSEGGSGGSSDGGKGGKTSTAGKGGSGGMMMSSMSTAGKGGSGMMMMGEHKESAECVACEMKPPSTDPQAANCPDSRNVCMKLEGRATGGSLVGEKKSTLCLSLLTCMHATECAYAARPASAVTDCFCGTGVDPQDCKEKKLADMKGACKDEFAAAAESDDPMKIIEILYDNIYGLGAALAVVETCDDFFCPVCFPGVKTRVYPMAGMSGGAGMSGAAGGAGAAGSAGAAGAH